MEQEETLRNLKETEKKLRESEQDKNDIRQEATNLINKLKSENANKEYMVVYAIQFKIIL